MDKRQLAHAALSAAWGLSANGVPALLEMHREAHKLGNVLTWVHPGQSAADATAAACPPGPNAKTLLPRLKAEFDRRFKPSVRGAFGTTLIIAMLVLAVSEITWAGDLAQVQIARIMRIQGKVSVLSTGSVERAVIGMAVGENDRIRTDAGGRVLLIFTDGTRAIIGEKAEVAMDRYLTPHKTRRLLPFFDILKRNRWIGDFDVPVGKIGLPRADIQGNAVKHDTINIPGGFTLAGELLNQRIASSCSFARFQITH